MAESGLCTPGNCSQESLHYTYTPSLAGNATLLALFGIQIPFTFILGVSYRASIFAITIIAGLCLEVMGYAARVYLAVHQPGNVNAFILSLVGTVIGPAFISLAAFRLLPPIVSVYGDPFHAWRPSWHNVAFYAFTTACVVLQLVGVIVIGLARTTGQIDAGEGLTVAGLAIQILSLFIFIILGLRFALAVKARHRALSSSQTEVYNSQRFKAFLLGLSLAVLLILTRSLYRVVAISEGFSSALTKDEVLFLILDGVLVFIAAAVLLATFPERMLEPPLAVSVEATSTSPRHPFPVHRMTLKDHRPSRTTPPALSPASRSPDWNRMSSRSHGTNTSGGTHPSPRRSPPQQQMVSSDALW